MDKRIPVALARARWLVPAAALSLSGCPNQELAPLGPCTVSAVSERVDQTGIADVDLLFMVDNSGSMATEQIKLAAQLPTLVGVLTTGDRYYGRTPPAGITQQEQFFTKVKTLHLGVVSSNMGGIDEFPSNALEAVLSCQGEGDEGRLQHSTEIAQMTITETRGGRNPEFPGYVLDEVVLEADPECDLGTQPPYQDYSADGSLTPEKLATNFRCVARLGVRGCPFEQQLESTWRALAPSDGKGDQYKFLNGTKGQGDMANDGFLRDEAILAIMVVTDEDDCSIKDAGKVMFALDDATKDEYGPINLRCGLNETNSKFLWPADRYIDGFKSLKPDYPDRIIFGAITGVPLETGTRTIDEILMMPDMEFREKQPEGSGLPEPSCTADDNSNPDNPKVSEAYPPRRILEVARGFKDQAVIYSICNDDFAPALNTLIEKIAAKLKGNCLPRKLTRTDEGTVNCQVFELLPKNANTKCVSDRGHIGDPVKRKLRENGDIVTREACEMSQVSVDNNATDPSKKGWYYDDFSMNLMQECPNAPQRISFQFANGVHDLPSGAGAVFECFQPVARVETEDVKGFDAVNTRCVDSDSACDSRSNDDYTLICIDHKTCQIKCQDNPDCPPGWVCATGNGGTGKGDPYCQLPTCPQDEAAGSTASSESGDET